MSDEPRLTWAAIAPAIPFVGLGLVLLGVRTVVFGVTDGSVLLAGLGVGAAGAGAAVAWWGFRRVTGASAGNRPHD